MRNGRFFLWIVLTAAGALCLLLAACDGPIVARSPEALYALANEQLANARFTPAADTLGRLVREAGDTEQGRRAQILRLALLGGMARAYKNIAESYRAGSEQAGAASSAPALRSVSVDYFGRARGRSIEMVEGLAPLLGEQPLAPVRVDYPLPQGAGAALALAQVRRGQPLRDDELTRVEREEIRRGLAEMLAVFVGAGGDVSRALAREPNLKVEPAPFYLGAAQELVEMSSIYAPEALGDRRMSRLYHERAATLANRAAQLAAAQGNKAVQEEAESLVRHCQEILQKH